MVDTQSEDSGTTDTSRSVLSEKSNVQQYAKKRHSDKSLSHTSADDTIEQGGVKKRRLKRPGQQFFSNPMK